MPEFFFVQHSSRTVILKTRIRSVSLLSSLYCRYCALKVNQVTGKRVGKEGGPGTGKPANRSSFPAYKTSFTDMEATQIHTCALADSAWSVGTDTENTHVYRRSLAGRSDNRHFLAFKVCAVGLRED